MRGPDSTHITEETSRSRVFPVDDRLTLAVPPVVRARYLVPTALAAAEVKDRVREALPSRVCVELARAVDKSLDTSLVTVTEVQSSAVQGLPVNLQRYLGATDEQVQAVMEASSLVQIRAVYTTGWPPMHEWLARSAAGVLAADLGVPLVDTRVPSVMSGEKALAALPDTSWRIRLADWMLNLNSAGDLGLWFTTKGLGRFGLPELQAHNVPPNLAARWGYALNGLASALLGLWLRALQGPGEDRPAFVELPAEVTVSEADVADAQGDEPRGGGSARVRLTLDPATSDRADSFLTVQPPHDFAASAGEHVAAVCAALFGKPEPSIQPAPRHAMDQAIATARGHLPAARERLLSGDLPLEARLMVKHQAATTGAREFVWAYVTSWSQPETVLATCADDALGDPSIRSGRPIVIPADKIIDWAVWIDGPGVVEGGWTNDLVAGDAEV
ncbi:MAG TPA: hypothetical protein VGS19_02635 [Streptosporangiaceae bacterium]|nr:hypothetical protein [Streptosporangiaceae bacterium]